MPEGYMPASMDEGFFGTMSTLWKEMGDGFDMFVDRALYDIDRLINKIKEIL